MRKSLGQSRHCFSTTLSTCQLIDYQCDLEELEAGADTDGFQGHLYRGPLLTTIDINSEPWNEWLDLERDKVHLLVVGSWRRLGEQALANGDNTRAVEIGNRLVRLDPIYEPGHQLVIAGYKHAGRNSEANRAYRACEVVLRRELAVAPNAETSRIIAPDPVLAPRAPNTATHDRGYRIGYENGRMAGYRLAISHLTVWYDRSFADRPIEAISTGARRAIEFLCGRYEAAAAKRQLRLAGARGAETRANALPNRPAVAAD